MELQRDAPHFDRIIPIELVQGKDLVRSTNLTFRVLSGSRSCMGSNQPEKLFRFELTEEQDPYFLYFLDIGESEFHVLKNEHNIRVEFSLFPRKLIELVELCCLQSRIVAPEDDTAAVSNSLTGSPSHVVRLDQLSGVFCIFENNQFNQLLHIALRFKAGNDAAIKAYLSSRLYFSTNESIRLRDAIAGLTDNVSRLELEKQGLMMELQRVMSHREVDVQSLQSKHASELSELRNSSMDELEQTRAHYELQLKELRDELEVHRRTSQRKVEGLEAKIDELRVERSHFEYLSKDLQGKMTLSDTNNARLADDVQQLTAERRSLEQLRSQLEREVAKLTAKVEAFVQQVRDKDDMVGQATTITRATEQAKVAVEQKLLASQQECERLREQLKAGAAELVRGNQQIERLKCDTIELREKLKTKNEVIRRQEAKIGELTNRLSGLDNDLRVAREELQLIRHDRDKITQELELTGNRLKESKDTVAKQENVIKFLSEEQTKYDSGLRMKGNFENIRTTVSSPQNVNDILAQKYSNLSTNYDDINAVDYMLDKGTDSNTNANQFGMDTVSGLGRRTYQTINPDSATPTSVPYRHTPYLARHLTQPRMHTNFAAADTDLIPGTADIYGNASKGRASLATGSSSRHLVGRYSPESGLRPSSAVSKQEPNELRNMMVKGVKMLGLAEEFANDVDVNFDELDQGELNIDRKSAYFPRS